MRNAHLGLALTLGILGCDSPSLPSDTDNASGGQDGGDWGGSDDGPGPRPGMPGTSGSGTSDDGGSSDAGSSGTLPPATGASAEGGDTESGSSDSETGADCGSPGALARAFDPVVFEAGDVDLGTLEGVAPSDIVAFRYEGAWERVPVQVDERDVVSFVAVYDLPYPADWTRVDYTDSGTHTGPDSDPGLDANDEIVFMAHDTGGRPCADAGEPPGVVPGSGVVLTVRDPLDGSEGWLVLFENTGVLDPSAGASYVDYDFDLLSGSYATYDTLEGPNPEDTWVETASYRRHFADRWITDALEITAEGASGVDILDRHKNQFGPNLCQRTENSFSAGEGAFVVNRAGPVRTLRSYVGANSGPLTQRTHAFYAAREDVITDLRVHPINGIMDFYDYGPDAVGMAYTNDSGVSLTLGSQSGSTQGEAPRWERVAGPQGVVTHIHTLESTLNINGITELWHLDLANPGGAGQSQCTGDAAAIGQSGTWVNGSLANTDPTQNGAALLAAKRTLYYEGAQSVSAATMDAWVREPLEVDAMLLELR